MLFIIYVIFYQYELLNKYYFRSSFALNKWSRAMNQSGFCFVAYLWSNTSFIFIETIDWIFGAFHAKSCEILIFQLKRKYYTLRSHRVSPEKLAFPVYVASLCSLCVLKFLKNRAHNILLILFVLSLAEFNVHAICKNNMNNENGRRYSLHVAKWYALCRT